MQYPALLSGTAGSIAYAYDRIGNMLSQSSNITATENGLPLTNLGTMSYGGTAVPSGRIGRSSGQPGPHALTAVSGGSRSYPYDANGNMETIDGMTCTSDFKDRLIAVENAQMRADYTYDYTDRRITKRVLSKSPPLPISPSSPEYTIYVDRTYELRPSGEPTKYVWNGETRVARVTTNLNATQRLQRFTLHPGWNLCTLAVALTNAGTLLRIRASAVGELAVRGTPAAAASVNYPAGRHWIGNATFQPLDLATALPAEAPLWFWQSSTQAWRYRLRSALSTASDAPARLEPGEAIFALHTAAFTLAPADPTLEVRFYHQDHLGSSSVMTDATGQLVSESTFYPFGHPRNEHEPRNMKEAYGFTQKERDGESGLNYFEARFLYAATNRMCSVDPVADMVLSPIADGNDNFILRRPQYHNTYAYALNNPLCLKDSSGCLTIIVPGTWNVQAEWKGSRFQQQVEKTFGEKAIVLENAGMDNTKSARLAASQQLVSLINKLAKDGEPINIVAHSHGGNVAALASFSKELRHKIEIIVNLNRPIRSDYTTNRPMVNRMINAFSYADEVQPYGGACSDGRRVERAVLSCNLNPFSGSKAERLHNLGAQNIDVTRWAPGHSDIRLFPQAWDKLIEPAIQSPSPAQYQK